MTEGAATQRNRQSLEAAAGRLLAGEATISDGKLTLKSLAAEAAVPRNYLYRTEYLAVARDFLQRAQARQERNEGPGVWAAQHERLRTAQSREALLAKRYRGERDTARAERDQAASQIAFLTEQNRMLREDLESERSVTRLATKRDSG